MFRSGAISYTPMPVVSIKGVSAVKWTSTDRRLLIVSEFKSDTGWKLKGFRDLMKAFKVNKLTSTIILNNCFQNDRIQSSYLQT